MGFLHARRLDPLLLDSPLRRPFVAGTVCLLLILAVAWVTLVFLDFFGGVRADVVAVLVSALGAATVLSAVPLAVLWFLDRRERESPWLVAVAFLWGAFMATGLALPVNDAILLAIEEWVDLNPAIVEALGPDAALMLGAPVGAPVVEEVTKGLGLAALFLFLRAEFDNMRDGFIYGALIGLGFNWFEAPLYVAQSYVEQGVVDWPMQLAWRFGLFGFAGHPLFTALFGASLGLALQTRRVWLKVLAPACGLALAIAAHAYNNVLPLVFTVASAAADEPYGGEDPPAGAGLVDFWLGASAVQLTLFLPFVVLAGLALWRSGVWERRVIREELADEVGRSVTPEEYEAVLADRVFRTRRIDAANRRVSAALVNAQHELAFRKRRVRDAGRDPEADPLVGARREEIRLLRGRLA